jgi:hypothetical protein
MSIESRLSSGLAANTEHLVSDLELERELRTVLRRAHTRRRVRLAGVAVVAAAAVLAVVVWLSGGLGLHRGDAPPNPIETPKVTEVGPQSMEGVDGALDAGAWAVPLYGKNYESLPRAVVEVPDGYGSPGGWTVDRGADGDPENYGAVDFWSVGTVLDDPCHPSTGNDPGTTVRDLADALVQQPGKQTTRPTPVTLDGHHGLYLEVTGPGRKQLDACQDATYTLWRSDDDFPNRSNIPGTVWRLWILDVDGTRIVVNESTTPHETKAEKAEVLAIARSTHFIDPRATSP